MTQEQTTADNCDLLELMKLLAIQPFNLNKYREYGRVHGFNGFYGRELSWNQIVHMTDKNFTTRGTFEENKKLAESKSLDEKMTKQIKVDVDRSLNSIDEFENWTQSEIEDFRTDLYDVLITIFTLNPNYNYYQGFHDVATVFLYQLGKEAGFQALMHICHAFHRDALSFPFEKSITQQLRLVFKVLRAYDPAHADLLDELYEGVPMFAIPWLLTWFAHSIKSIDDILRIYDFLLSSPPQTIIYMCAALLITTKEELLASASEIDMPACHMFYQRLEIEDVELLIATTIEMELNCDIGMQVLTLDGALVEESLLASFESIKYINKDYIHPDQNEALELLEKAKKNEREWTSKVAVKFSLAGLAIAGAFAAFKSGERSSLVVNM